MSIVDSPPESRVPRTATASNDSSSDTMGADEFGNVANRLAESINQNSPLGQRLIGANLISAEDLETALQVQEQRGDRFGEVLLEMGVVTEEQLLPFIANRLGVKGARLREGLVDPAAVHLIPREVSERLDCIALFRIRDVLTVAVSDPLDLRVIDELEEITGIDINPVFAFRSSIQRILARCYESDFQVDAITADMDESAVELQADLANVDLALSESQANESPVINLVNYLILQALQKGASDIHIEPTQKFSVVRFRIDGQLVEVLRPRSDIHPAIVSRIKVMGKMDIAEHRAPQDGRCQVAVDGKRIDLRISTLPTVLGEKVVMRVLDKSRLTFDLEQLGIPPQSFATIKTLLAKPHGLMLVTGPTGSGKTTTLYSALELVKSVHRNIVTVEDPVEYQIELINQVQVDKGRSLSFAGALRSILRQDPDVIMVGEIRDRETAEVAIQAALTGHLVLSTLHTNDSVGAVARLMDMGIDSFKVSAALVGVVAQRLVRTICPNCRTSYYPPAETLDLLRYEGDRRRSFARGEGCKNCFDTGFKGRLGIYEVLEIDHAMREQINAQTDINKMRKWFVEQGGVTLLQSGIRRVELEQTSFDEVIRVAYVE